MSNLNTLNQFTQATANLDIGRSRFRMPHSVKTTFKAGDLVPVDLIEVLPGDTFDIDFSSVIRMITPVAPVMDMAYLDVYAFFVPNRIACKHPKDWEKICGENVNGFWAPTSEATLQNTGNTIPLASKNVALGSVANYYGLPINNYSSSDSLKISSLPFNGYISIWNEWFRDQNTQAPLSFASESSYATYFSGCLQSNKLHDYFTTCLPAPQKGAAVLLPLGGEAPIIPQTGAGTQYKLYTTNNVGANGVLNVGSGNLVARSADNSSQVSIVGSNLVADLTAATAATITQLRQAFAIQRILEKDARGGSRYRELLKVHFGASIPDSTIQIPEYLGGKRVPLNITQVLQTSSTDNVSPIGSTGAFSNTAVGDKLCFKSFDEHGYIHILCTVRNSQSYSQGILKHWTRNRRYDWYYPAFANLSEQPVYKRELFYDSRYVNYPDEVFGYQEAWAEYRYQPNLLTGAVSANSGDTWFRSWTYGNYWTSQPTLNSDFMKQPSSQIGNTLVNTTTGNQFLADFYFDTKATRAMPMYSIPGLIDHH